METRRHDSSAHLIPELDRKGLRNFALTTGSIFVLLFGLALPWLFGHGYPRWPWILAAVLISWGLIAPATLKPVYILWMKLALLLNKVTTPIILGVTFFLVIMPVGLVMRLFGRDSMHRKLESASDSYRVDVKPRGKEHMERPF